MAGRGRDAALPAWQQGGIGGSLGGPAAQQGFPPSQGGWPGPSQQARPAWGGPQQGGYPAMQRPAYGPPQGVGPQQYPGAPRQGMPQMGQPGQGYPGMPGPGVMGPAGMRPAASLPPAPLMAPAQMQHAPQQYIMPQQQMQGRGPPVMASPQPQAQTHVQTSPAVQASTVARGRKYYYNAATKQSSWTRPPDSAEAQQPVKPEPVAVAHEQAGKPAEVQCDWKEFTSPDGRKYYYNRVTKVSVWQMPEELKRAQAQAAGTKAAKSDPGGVQVLKLSEPSPSPARTPGLNGNMENAQRIKAEQDINASLPAPKKPIIYATKEEAKEAFKELLASVGTASNATWEATMRLIVNDQRYEAFKTIGEKKACFNEYLQQRAKEEKEESRTKAKQTRDAFFTLLELSPELKTGTRYSKAAAMFDDEPRWKAIREPREREQLFNEHMKERERKEKEHRRAELKKKKAAFKALLEANKSIRVDTVWRKAQSKLEGEDEYENLEKIDRLDVFQDHIRDLEKREKERREKEKEEKRRVERKNRDAFKVLLKQHKDDGKILPKMRWKEYYAIIEDEDILKAIEKNVSGSRPKELFEDFLEEVEQVYIKNRSSLRDAKLEIQADTAYDSFIATLEERADEALTAIPDYHRKLFFDEEVGKQKEKAAKEERRRRNIREDFHKLLRDTRRLRHDTTWADAKVLLEKEPEYKAMESKEKEEIFTEFIEKLKEKHEKEKEREKEREEKRARKAEEEEKPRKEKKRHKKDRHGDKDKGTDKKSKDKDRHTSKRRHNASEGEEEKRSSKKHRIDKDKARDKETEVDEEAAEKADEGPEPSASPRPARDLSGTELEQFHVDQPKLRRPNSDSEEGQL